MKAALIYAFLFFGLIISSPIFAQENNEKLARYYLEIRGEVVLNIGVSNPSQIHQLASILSIDKVEQFSVIAYANLHEFEAFLQLKLPYQVLVPPSLRHHLKTGKKHTKSGAWDYYPTYQEYEAMMQDFATNYPDICTFIDAGNTINGHRILFLKISDNVTENELEPEFMYSSSMHGDELTGYILNLRLADYLLSNYQNDALVTQLVDGLEIYINPLANPDGAYIQNDTTVNGAIRYNANYVDINRNFPDPVKGTHPDNKEYQLETISMMNFASSHSFAMSANFHGGEEVVNYPWDFKYELHPDDEWFKFVSRIYADTAQQYSPAPYLTKYDNGITNGADWYIIHGSRQDYMNNIHQCREVTLEISLDKTPLASQLPLFWEYNYQSMLRYMQQALYGVQGFTTDSVTGKAISAKVNIQGHDDEASYVDSDTATGYYIRYLKEGSYDITFSSSGYQEKTIADVQVVNYKTTFLDVALAPREPSHVDSIAVNWPDENSFLALDIYAINPGTAQVKIYNIEGRLCYAQEHQYFSGENRITINFQHQDAGVYILKYISTANIVEKKFVKLIN